jgi:hypothetical protein
MMSFGEKDRHKHRIETSPLTWLQDKVLGYPFFIVVLAWLGAYVAVGLVFATLYGLNIHDLNPPKDKLLRASDVVSFSFVTQATIGYGDVTPAGWCRLLANLQAVVGTGLNGAAVGILTLRILKRKPPLRVPRQISFFESGKGRFAFKFRYVNVDSHDLVDTYVSVFFSAASRTNSPYDAVGGDVGSMQLETVDPLGVKALVIEAKKSRTPLHDPKSKAMLNDAKIALNPEMFIGADGLADPSAKLLLRIRGFHASTGEMFALSQTYRAADIMCAPFDGIDNNPLEHLDAKVRRGKIREKFERFERAPSERCSACAKLPVCPFSAGRKAARPEKTDTAADPSDAA